MQCSVYDVHLFTVFIIKYQVCQISVLLNVPMSHVSQRGKTDHTKNHHMLTLLCKLKILQ